MSKDATEDMLVTYHELNGDIEELYEDPSPLDFMRFVARNRPFVVRGGCSPWPAMRKWSVAYLKETMRGIPIKVAITPCGSVSSILRPISITRALNVFKAMPTQRSETR